MPAFIPMTSTAAFTVDFFGDVTVSFCAMSGQCERQQAVKIITVFGINFYNAVFVFSFIFIVMALRIAHHDEANVLFTGTCDLNTRCVFSINVRFAGHFSGVRVRLEQIIATVQQQDRQQNK
jgi:hypothetical protein